MTRLSDNQVRQLRQAAHSGVRVAELARRFEVSRAYAHRLASGRARPLAMLTDDEMSPIREATARLALDQFVSGLGQLRGERAALAALAGVLAERLDAVAGLDTAAAVTAAERVTARLVEIVERLAADEAHEGAEQAARRMLRAIA